MSTDQKLYRRVVPIAPGVDADTLRWLTRESFENTAAVDHLVVVEYAERDIHPAEIPVEAADDLDLPIERYRWVEFSATAVPAERELPHLCGCCPHAPHEAGQCAGEDGYTVVDGKCSCPWPV